MLRTLTTTLGALLLAVFVAAPAAFSQPVVTFSGDTSDDPVYARASSADPAFCAPSTFATAVAFETQSFMVPADGDYAVQVDDTPGYDEYLYLYEGSFDPDSSTVCDNLLALDDDIAGFGSGSRIESINLTAGTSYIAVITGFANADAGPYTGFVEENDPPPADEAGDIVNEPAADAVGQTTIIGLIADDADEDCYAIEITDAANFSATVVDYDETDTQLFLFDGDADGVYYDDDGGLGLLSAITPDSVAANGGMISNGDALLCITDFNNDALNSDGDEIFPEFTDPNGDEGPPAVTNIALADWNDAGSVAFGGANYEIALTGVTGGGGPNFDLTASLSTTTVAPGGSITVNFTVDNNTASAVTGDLFFTAAPGGLQGNVFNDVTVAGGASVSNSYVQNVPPSAPPGTYTYTVRIGQFPGTTVDSEAFTVTVTGSARGLDLDAAMAEAKLTRDESLYKAALKEVGEWTAVAARPWTSESTVSAAARAEFGAFPNPFARTTEIGFELDKATDALLVVYDVRGREVATLVDAAMDAGQHSVTFDASDLPSGVYVYRLQAGAQVETGRMTVLK
ncbi:MAG: T9SS type A sorting domain-containing protein [Bacteroidota bacterium]